MLRSLILRKLGAALDYMRHIAKVAPLKPALGYAKTCAAAPPEIR